MNLERRLKRLEQYLGGGRCSVCAPLKRRLEWVFINEDKELDAPNHCPACGRKVTVEFFEIDEILHGVSRGEGMVDGSV